MTAKQAIENLAKFFYDHNIHIHNGVRVMVGRDGAKLAVIQRSKCGELVWQSNRWSWEDRPCEAAYSFCCEDLRKEFDLYHETKIREEEMNNSGYQPTKSTEPTEKPTRFPKACKVQMFTKHEQVWMDALTNSLRGRTDGLAANIAIDAADKVLVAFKERFE